MSYSCEKNIEISWWTDEELDESCNIDMEELEDRLMKNAIGRIKEMTEQGYFSGELIEEFENESCVVYFSGYWAITEGEE